MSSTHGNPSLTDEQAFYAIAQEITRYLGKVLASRPYIAIADLTGTIHYIDSSLERFSEFIQNFVRTNFNLLRPGDHSLPLGGVNLAFFKVSEKAMVILYTVKGLSGQLLAFKTKMFEWTSKIEILLKDVIVAAEPTVFTAEILTVEPKTTISGAKTTSAEPPRPEKRRGLKTVPVLRKKLTGKEKFSIEIATILQYCDGNYTITQIRDATGYPLLKINEVIRMYQKKNWIELKRVV